MKQVHARGTARRVSALGAAILACLCAAACGSSGGGSGTSAKSATTAGSTTSAKAAHGSTIVATTGFNYAPWDFYGSGQQPQGIDVDIVEMIAAELGMDVKWVANGDVGGMILGVQQGKYDVDSYSVYDTTERQAVVDLVDYMWVADQLVVPVGNPKKLSPDNLCGATVGQAAGTSEIAATAAVSAQCVKDGKPAIKMPVFPTVTDLLVAVSAGRADAAVESTPSALELVKTQKSFAIVPGVFPGTAHNVALAVKKGSPLVAQFTTAITTLMKSGKYKSFLDTWGLGQYALNAPTLNNATPPQ
jgi:polar amino acid transport system substrate-binding protein